MGLAKMRQIRHERRLTLEALAIKLGTSRGYLSKVENNKTECSLKMARKIAKLLKCTIDDLL